MSDPVQSDNEGDTMTTRRRLEALAWKEGKWWYAEIPELGRLTCARKRRNIKAFARDLAAVTLDVSEKELDVRINFIRPVDRARTL